MQTAHGWNSGRGADFCPNHYTELLNETTKNGARNYPQGLLNDYIRIGLLMRDTNRVLAELQRLETFMGNSPGHQQAEGGDYARLSVALEHYESRRRFPAVKMILMACCPARISSIC